MEMFYVIRSTFLIHWQQNAELKNVGTTHLTIIIVTLFQIEFQIIEIPLIKYSTNRYLLKAGWD